MMYKRPNESEGEVVYHKWCHIGIRHASAETKWRLSRSSAESFRFADCRRTSQCGVPSIHPNTRKIIKKNGKIYHFAKEKVYHLSDTISFSSSSDFAPVIIWTLLPSFQKWKAGTARMPSRCINRVVSGLASPITLTKTTSVYFSDSSSKRGAMALQGPHHVVE